MVAPTICRRRRYFLLERTLWRDASRRGPVKERRSLRRLASPRG